VNFVKLLLLGIDEVRGPVHHLDAILKKVPHLALELLFKALAELVNLVHFEEQNFALRHVEQLVVGDADGRVANVFLDSLC